MHEIALEEAEALDIKIKLGKKWGDDPHIQKEL